MWRQAGSWVVTAQPRGPGPSWPRSAFGPGLPDPRVTVGVSWLPNRPSHIRRKERDRFSLVFLGRKTPLQEEPCPPPSSSLARPGLHTPPPMEDEKGNLAWFQHFRLIPGAAKVPSRGSGHLYQPESGLFPRTGGGLLQSRTATPCIAVGSRE